MKKLILITLSIVLLNTITNAQMSFKIEEMKVMSFNLDTKYYQVEQDWTHYEAFMSFQWEKMYFGPEGLDPKKTITHNVKTGFVDSIKDGCINETSVWYISGTDSECLVNVKYLKDGSILIDYIVNSFFFQYKAKFV